jgi:hypothetical protein
MAAPLGNNNAGKAKRWQKALERALARSYGDVDSGLTEIAAIVVESASKGDREAWTEIGNRIDGKPAQAVEHTGPDGNALVVTWLTAQVSE